MIRARRAVFAIAGAILGSALPAAAQNNFVPPSVLPAGGNSPAVGAPPGQLPGFATTSPTAPAFPAPPHVESSPFLDVTPPGGLGEPHGGGHGNGHGNGHGAHGGGGHGALHCQAMETLNAGWFGSAEFLLWRSRLDGNDYALVDPMNNGTPQGRMENLGYKVAGGVRGTLGYRLESGWDVGLTYTYFRSGDNGSVNAPPGGILYPTWTRPGLVDTSTFAQANSVVNYNTYDLDIGRTWAVDHHLTLRAFGGVRYASIDIKQSSVYDGALASATQVFNKSAFDGAGPTAGGEARWNVTESLGLFGTARGGLLYGDFRGSVRETSAAGAVVNQDISDGFGGVAPFMNIGLGGSWKWKNLSFAAGYEVTHYFNTATRPVLTDDFSEGKVSRRRGDLSFDGVFFRLGVNY